MKSGRILITDDNEKNRKLLKVILEKTGFEVFEAVNGLQAVELSADNNFDLILMDYRMPLLDGIEATKIIKSGEKTAATPVFMVTSSAMHGDRERIISSSGCDRLFTKPINFHELLNAINEIMREN